MSSTPLSGCHRPLPFPCQFTPLPFPYCHLGRLGEGTGTLSWFSMSNGNLTSVLFSWFIMVLKIPKCMSIDESTFIYVSILYDMVMPDEEVGLIPSGLDIPSSKESFYWVGAPQVAQW